jgi:hypothetical protein
VNHIILEEKLIELVELTIAYPTDPLQADRGGHWLVWWRPWLEDVGRTPTRVPQKDRPLKDGGSMAERCFPRDILVGAKL